MNLRARRFIYELFRDAIWHIYMISNDVMINEEVQWTGAFGVG